MSNINLFSDYVNCLAKIDLLPLYVDSVPFHPHCTDKLGQLITLPKKTALQKRYLQHNPPFSISTLVIDHDDPESHYLWDDYHAPPPQFAVMNPVNGHCHLLYMIRNKVYKNRSDNLKPFRLLSAIEDTLIQKLGADPSYCNFISKNPLHNSWTLYPLQGYLYDLSDFFDYLPISNENYSHKRIFTSGLGRNCTVFENLRHRAYSLIRDVKFSIDLDVFIKELYNIAQHKYNLNFNVPLSEQELYGIAKSIGKWTYSHYSNDDFIAFCKRRGKASGKVRQEKASLLYKEIKEVSLKNPTFSNRQIAKLLNTSEFTVRRAKKFLQPTSDDNELFQERPTLFEL